MALDGGADGRRPFLISSDWRRIQNFFAIFTYLCLFMAFIKTKISLDVVEVIATEWKLLLSYYHPIFPSFDAIQFLFILPHLCLLISNPLTLFSLLDPLTSLPLILTKMLSLGSVAMISIKKKAYQSHHRLIFSPYLLRLWGLKWKCGFSNICALPWASPWHFFIFC